MCRCLLLLSCAVSIEVLLTDPVDLADQLLDFQSLTAADGRLTIVFHAVVEVRDLPNMLEPPVVLAAFIDHIRVDFGGNGQQTRPLVL